MPEKDNRTEDISADVKKSLDLLTVYRTEMARAVVGQKALVDGILAAAVGGGHALLEGVPGVAKTLAVKTFASLFSLGFKRLQFTPDLLPSDLTGTLIYNRQDGSFSVRKGPLFTNIILADEVNRAPAKVQSALLEAMAERQVTIGEDTLPLPSPFLVLATQNPVEHEGTYRLPEAELDRFFLKLVVGYPSPEEERQIVLADAGAAEAETETRKAVFSASDLHFLQTTAASIHCEDALIRYMVALTAATRPVHAERHAPGGWGDAGNGANTGSSRGDYLQYIRLGASPRAAVSLCRYAKIRAMFAGREWVSPEDVKDAAFDVFRHRITLSYEASASGVTAGEVVSMILDAVALP